MKRVYFLFVLVVLFFFVSSATFVFAGTGWFDYKGTCTTDLCQSKVFTSQYKPGEPVVVQLFANVDEVLRVEVTADGGNDLTMTLISPRTGIVWYDDDSGSALKPRIEVADTPLTGWYTLVIGSWTGDGGSKRAFTVKYGRYDLGNMNGSSPTPLIQDYFNVATDLDESLIVPGGCKTHPDTRELICP